MIQARVMLLVGLIFLAALSRLMPHPPNFAPICAIGLFGGAMFAQKRWAFLVPAVAMLVSDAILYLGTYDAWREYFMSTSLPVYMAFLLTICIGLWLKSRVSVKNIVATSLTCSALFFLISNLGWWMFSGMYPMDFAGLAQCFWAAIPFFQNNFFGSPLLNTFLGDAFYVAVLFGTFAFVERRLPTMQLNPEPALSTVD